MYAHFTLRRWLRLCCLFGLCGLAACPVIARDSINAHILVTGYTTNCNVWSVWNFGGGGFGGVAQCYPITGNGTMVVNFTNAYAFNLGNWYGMKLQVGGGCASSVCQSSAPLYYLGDRDNFAHDLNYNIDLSAPCGGVQSQVTTNTITGCVTNRLGFAGQAYFRRNTINLLLVTLQPGQSQCYTFDYNPSLDTCSWGMLQNTVVIYPDGPNGLIVTNQASDTPFGSFGLGTNDVVNNPTSTNQMPFGAFTNGTVNWAGEATTAAKDDTLKVGFQLLHNDNQDQAALLASMAGSLQTNGGSGGSGFTNDIQITVTNGGIGQLTNFDGLTSNQVVGFGQGATNFISSFAMSAYDALSNRVVGPVGAEYSNLIEPNFGIDPSFDDGGEIQFEIAMPPGAVPFHVDTSTIPAHDKFALARSVIAWAIYVFLLVKLFKTVEMFSDRLLSQRQIQGSNQELWGFNASVVTAIVYGGILAAFIGSIPTAAAAYLASAHSGMAAHLSDVTSLVGTLGYNASAYVFPIGVFVTGMINYLLFRYVIGIPLVIIARLAVVCMVS